MLAGLSPSRLAVRQHRTCVRRRGRRSASWSAPLVSLDAQTLAFAGRAGARCRAARRLHVVRHRLLRRARDRRRSEPDPYWSVQSLVPAPTPRRAGAGACPSCSSSWSSCSPCFCAARAFPAAARSSRSGMPAVPRPDRLFRPSVIAAVVGAVALDRLPLRLPAGADQLAARRRHLSLARRHRRLRRPDLRHATRARRRRGLHHVAPHDGAGGIWSTFPIPLLIGAAVATVVGLLVAVSALRVRGVSLAVVTLAATVAIEQFGFANARWGGGVDGIPGRPSASRWPQSRARRVLPRPGRGAAEPDLRLPRARGDDPPRLLVANVRRSSLGQRMLAVRSNERAAAAAGINVRNTKLAGFGIAAFIAGMAGALYAYNFGSVSSSRFGAVASPRPDRVRVLRRDHYGLGCRDRRVGRDRRRCSRTRSTGPSACPGRGRCWSAASR